MEKLKRTSGVLMHITSLPSDYSLGNFSCECEKFIDFLSLAGFGCWQVLPFGDCGYGYSPYSVMSSFAMNPYFLDIKSYLNEEEFLSLGISKALAKDEMESKYNIAFEMIYDKYHMEYNTVEFEKTNAYWLDSYATYKAIKLSYGNVSWVDFPTQLKDKVKSAVDNFKLKNTKLIKIIKFIQFLLDSRWREIKSYAGTKSIEILGDMPMYVEMDSADIWNNRKDWKLKGDKPSAVAGVPPDYFNENGQLWGNPIYNYTSMANSGYKFWKERFKRAYDIYDIVRIDHFVAFSRYWEILGNATSAKNGSWKKGKGEDILSLITKMHDAKLIAEDLGIVTDDVIKLREKYNIPGLKLIEFAFDSNDDHMYRPHNYEKNTVAYIGTHDNDTFMGMLSEGNWDKINRIKRYLRMPIEWGNDAVVDNMIATLYASSADMIILTTQDILKLGKSARMNVPGVVNDTNWKWQLDSAIDNGLAPRYRELSEIYGRLPSKL